MLRTVGGVILGYIAMAAIVFVGLTAAYTLLGPDRAFRPGVYEVSFAWVVVSIIVGFLAAILGGWLARVVGATPRAPQVLAGLVVVLGLALALPALLSEPAAADVRTGAPGVMEAMQQARTPLWLMLLNPVIGAIGVLLGGSLGSRQRTIS